MACFCKPNQQLSCMHVNHYYLRIQHLLVLWLVTRVLPWCTIERGTKLLGSLHCMATHTQYLSPANGRVQEHNVMTRSLRCCRLDKQLGRSDYLLPVHRRWRVGLRICRRVLNAWLSRILLLLRELLVLLVPHTAGAGPHVAKRIPSTTLLGQRDQRSQEATQARASAGQKLEGL